MATSVDNSPYRSDYYSTSGGEDINSRGHSADQPRPFTSDVVGSKPGSAAGGVHITVYNSSRDGAHAHQNAVGRIGSEGNSNNNAAVAANLSSNSMNNNNTNTNVYSALDDLRFEILDANSQAIYLTQCQDYTTAEKLLVTTYNRLVELEHEQEEQLRQLEVEGERLTADEEVFEQRRQDMIMRLRGGGSAHGAGRPHSNHNTTNTTSQDPDVESPSATTAAAKQQQREELTELQAIEEELSLRRQELTQLSEQHKYATQLNDLLKATTLNNIAFVIYHRGMFVEALAHLESAQNLESKYGIQSPAVAINLCVLQNAVGDYDLATQYALLAIDMLRRTSVEGASSSATLAQTQQQPTTDGTAGTADGWRGQDPQQATGLAPTTFEEKKKLWGAAWHNLAIAQLQLADPKSVQQNSNVRLMFENSMAATIELLGKDHPMTRGVVESYRIVRKELRERGAYKPQRQLASGSDAGVPKMHTYFSEEALEQQAAESSSNGTAAKRQKYSAYTGRRIPAPSQRGIAKKEANQLSVILRTKDNVKYVEKIDMDPYTVAAGGNGNGNGSTTSSPNTPLSHQSRALVVSSNNNTNGVPLSPRAAQKQREAALAKGQSLASRKLSRGCPSSANGSTSASSARGIPLPPIGTPRGGGGGSSSARSGGQRQQQQTNILSRNFGPSSVNNKDDFFASSNAASGGVFPEANDGAHSQVARKHQIAKRTQLLGSSALQGNLALAVALYSNPHPLSSTTTKPPRNNLHLYQQQQNNINSAQSGNFATGSRGGGGGYYQQQQQQLPPPPSPRDGQQQLQPNAYRLPALTNGSVAPTASSSTPQFTPAPPSAPRSTNGSPQTPTQYQQQQQQQQSVLVPRPPSMQQQQQQRPSTNPNVGGGMLIGDMWVEAPIAPPRAPYNTSVATAGGNNSPPASRGGAGGAPSGRNSISAAAGAASSNANNGYSSSNGRASSPPQPSTASATANVMMASPPRNNSSYSAAAGSPPYSSQHAYPQQTHSPSKDDRVVDPTRFAHPDDGAAAAAPAPFATASSAPQIVGPIAMDGAPASAQGMEQEPGEEEGDEQLQVENHRQQQQAAGEEEVEAVPLPPVVTEADVAEANEEEPSSDTAAKDNDDNAAPPPMVASDASGTDAEAAISGGGGALHDATAGDNAEELEAVAAAEPEEEL